MASNKKSITLKFKSIKHPTRLDKTSNPKIVSITIFFGKRNKKYVIINLIKKWNVNLLFMRVANNKFILFEITLIREHFESIGQINMQMLIACLKNQNAFSNEPKINLMK